MLAFLFALGLSSAAAFSAPVFVPRTVMRVATPLMADKTLEEMASGCLEEGCPVDLVDDLIESLKADSAALAKKQQSMLVMIGRLQALNANPETNKNEIEKLVGAASRSFSVVGGFDFPGEPLGYSQKPSKGFDGYTIE